MSDRKYNVVLMTILFLLVVGWGVKTKQRAAGLRTIKVASAKGGVIGNQMRSISDGDQILWNLALNAPQLGELMAGKRVKLLSVLPAGVLESAEYPPCTTNCSHLRFYNFTDGGTIEAIFDRDTAQFVGYWQDLTARPFPTAYLIDDAVEIVMADEAVNAMLGGISKAQVAMIPMSMWLADDDCKDDWCVDLTFHDPEGSGKILHVITNLQQEKVARTFLTRGRENRQFQESADLDPNAESYTNGCHQANGWSVCWEMTPNDGLNFYDAAFNGQKIFSSIKIGQVEAYYPSWPGGYRDEIGYEASVPPKFDTRISDIDDGFEVRQLFTEPFDWPNCICCYRYEQVLKFFSDGSFGTQFVSQGPGCDELSEYRPFWRLDMAIGDNGQDRAYVWQAEQWQLVETEADITMFGDRFLDGKRLAVTNGDLTYSWIPEPTDPLDLDEGRIFLVDSEGDRDIIVGPADTYEPPRRYVTGESLVEEASDLAIWYVPVLKTKRGGPWWCQPDPEPEVNPCYSAMRFQRSGKLSQPTEQELAQLHAQPTATPVPASSPTPEADAVAEVAALPTLKPTPRPVSGQQPEEIILNAGCGACHAIGQLGEGGKVGPDLSNIAQVAAQRVPGQSAEKYLYNSIIYPNLYIAEQCPNGPCLANIMPGTYHLTLDEPQVQTLVSYLLTLADEREVVGEDSAENPKDSGATLAPPPDTAPPFPRNTILLGTGLLLIVASAATLIWLLVIKRGDSAEK